MLSKLYLVILLNYFVKQINCNVYQIVSTTETSNQKDDKTIILETQLKLYKEEILTKFEQISNKLVETNENFQKMNEKLIEIQSQTELLQEEIKNIKTAVPSYPRSCKEIQTRGSNFSGIYRIQPALGVESFEVLCDMKTRGGGWTYLMSRFDGSQEFYLNWENYKNGFGKLSGEFWLGLEHFYEITKWESMELLIELVDWEGEKRYAHYKSFEIGSEKEGYSLKSLAGYNGDAGDSMSYHIGGKFSTFDKDQDDSKKSNCASLWKGAWWYKACSDCALTETYKQGYGSHENVMNCMYWTQFHPGKENYCLKQSRMMVRPRKDHSSFLLPHEVST